MSVNVMLYFPTGCLLFDFRVWVQLWFVIFAVFVTWCQYILINDCRRMCERVFFPSLFLVFLLFFLPSGDRCWQWLSTRRHWRNVIASQNDDDDVDCFINENTHYSKLHSIIYSMIWQWRWSMFQSYRLIQTHQCCPHSPSHPEFVRSDRSAIGVVVRTVWRTRPRFAPALNSELNPLSGFDFRSVLCT